MISKELLSEVMGLEVTKIKQDSQFDTFIVVNRSMTINIYELSHKCKEWAFKNKYNISTLKHTSGKSYGKYYISFKRIDINSEIKTLNDIYTEPEAIFLACQWILDNK